MKKAYLLICFAVFISSINLKAQENKSPKVVLITLDGLRWQELFTGADSKLIAHEDYVRDSVSLKKQFWRTTKKDRREILFPFLWNDVPRMGQIYGNRLLDNNVNLTNKLLFSYPGYNEILTGQADDDRITSNNKENNPNKTILEIVNSSSNYKGKVAAFCSWDVFPFIINEERSGVPVNAGYETLIGDKLTESEILLNKLQMETPKLWGSVRLDAFTHNFALEHMKKERPELIYISYGETDDFAHEGHYDSYLRSAKRTDKMIQELWEFTQNDSFYKDNTVFLITTDHGRGTEPIDHWRSHGKNVEGADEVWLIIFGNNVKVKGEVSQMGQLQSIDLAPTVLSLLNVNFDQNKIKGKVLDVLEN